jgi:hypothetical protein
MVWGCCSWFTLDPLVPVKGHLNTTVYNFVATVWGRPFPVSACQCPRTQSEIHTEMVCRDRVNELDWPGQSPELNPIEQLWDELERRLRTRPNRPTSAPELTNALD